MLVPAGVCLEAVFKLSPQLPAALRTRQVGMVVVHPAVAAPEALFRHEGGDVAFSEFKDVITNKATTVVRCFPAASSLDNNL